MGVQPGCDDNRLKSRNMNNQKSIDYSIIVPVYYNEGSLRRLLAAIWQDVIFVNPDLNGEIIFVDDGSGDGSFAELQELQTEYPTLVRIVKLTRNFGQVNALLAGYSVAKGHCVVSISADGQDPPRLTNQMLEGFFGEGYEIVVCARREREESLYRRATSAFFYWMIRKLSF